MIALCLEIFCSTDLFIFRSIHPHTPVLVKPAFGVASGSALFPASKDNVSVIVANEDDWRASQTKSLLSQPSSSICVDSTDVKISDLFRSRAPAVLTRNGLPVKEGIHTHTA